MDLSTGDILILSGEGSEGSWERYYGARTVKAIRSKLYRERCHGDRWASAWIDSGSTGPCGDSVYSQLDDSLDQLTGRMRPVEQDDIRDNPAAMLASKKRGRSEASRENWKKGGRPKKA